MKFCGPTTDHDVIRRWAESQDAYPAEVYVYLHDGTPAVLRFLFGDPLSDNNELKPISWENFFAQFDAMGLTFVYEVDVRDSATGHYQILQIEEKSPYRFTGMPI